MSQLSDNHDASRVLSQTLDALAIRAGEKERDLLADYGAQLVRWSKRVNLTGASTLTEFFQGPLFDALTVIPVIEGSGSLVDVGSGGGLPGVPAAILFEHLKVTLVEPRARRAAFLRHVTHRMSLGADIIQARDEELVAGGWNGAVSQAVWSAPKWLERAGRLVAPGGSVYVLSTDPVTGSDLPTGFEVERELSISRPMDGARRWAARFRVMN
jgi:16S rRNA (guanine527-N7)-methyltransferase